MTWHRATTLIFIFVLVLLVVAQYYIVMWDYRDAPSEVKTSALLQIVALAVLALIGVKILVRR